jgi:hypothetical protein
MHKLKMFNYVPTIRFWRVPKSMDKKSKFVFMVTSKGFKKRIVTNRKNWGNPVIPTNSFKYLYTKISPLIKLKRVRKWETNPLKKELNNILFNSNNSLSYIFPSIKRRQTTTIHRTNGAYTCFPKDYTMSSIKGFSSNNNYNWLNQFPTKTLFGFDKSY